ncbi:hypothetical protein GGX14DRAFT_395879 [Mycena pura]|uniref:Uncharacterized protein n=1 Tax=Mycena pura TaxID=153505 RepID=A0AAD6VFD7_9AGAR|nr:hypothetical protein GGX14DRAFT_395879 [Mycena pura]
MTGLHKLQKNCSICDMQSYEMPSNVFLLSQNADSTSSSLDLNEHSFFRIHEPMTFLDDDEEYDADDHDYLTNATAVPERRVLAITTVETKRANNRRHAIAMSMWAQYQDYIAARNSGDLRCKETKREIGLCCGERAGGIVGNFGIGNVGPLASADRGTSRDSIVLWIV